MKKKVDFLECLLNPTLWRYEERGYVHYTCHDHYGSAYECDDTCGNCSGARCCDSTKNEQYPHIYVEAPTLYLMCDYVYGDMFTGELRNPKGEIIDAVRNGDRWYEDDSYAFAIIDSVPEDGLMLNDNSKSAKFFKELFALYHSLEKN